MKMYIRATGIISPQRTFGHPAFLAETVEYKEDRLYCAEPDYKEIIDVKWMRRMSRIIKMGVAAALECLQEAKLEMPDAIITGTAYGCMEDTGIFLNKMVENKEEMLTPTAFIQSTHNTVGAQIALILSCNKYNNTFVHRGFSFESALMDAILLLKENEANNILVGSADEITDFSHAILSRFGLYKKHLSSNLDLYKDNSKGTIAGEGASFFVLSNQPSGTDYAILEATTTFYKPENAVAIKKQVHSFLASQSLNLEEIDLLINGRNGDIDDDKIYEELNSIMFSDTTQISYKHLCGEYPTSSSFALWVAVNIVKRGALPLAAGNVTGLKKKIKRILIYNHYQTAYHSLFLIAAC
ncbi:MAG: beta-ketoacyl synthase chain length factor [Chitinophagaceae bacterium]